MQKSENKKDGFSPYQNQRIFEACYMIRQVMSLSLSLAGNKDKNKKEFDKLVHITSPGSDIGHLIKAYKWEELFKNEDWLKILRNVSDIADLRKERSKYDIRITAFLTLIAKSFPTQTKEILGEYKIKKKVKKLTKKGKSKKSKKRKNRKRK